MSLILDGSNGLSDVDGSAATPAIRGTDTNTGIFFPAADTIAFSEGGVEVARFDSAGNLGVGTTSPAYKLQIQSGANTILAGADSGALTLTNNTQKVMRFGVPHYANAEEPVGALFVSNESATSAIVIGGGTGQFNAATLVQFYTAANNTTTTGTERMRIDSNGALLVGTSSTFDNVSFLRVQSLGGVATKIAGTGLTSQMSFFNDNGRVGWIGTDGTTTSYNTSSDYRLKENIAPMVGALATVSALKPVTYNWKVDGSASQGFIAHELQAVVPECVNGEKDEVNAEGNPVYQGVDTSFLVATLTAAIQELKAELDTVKAELAALKA